MATIVVAAGWLASVVKTPASPRSLAEPAVWRRTTEGWEKFDHLAQSAPAVQEPTLHPLVVAAFQLLCSLLALLSLPDGCAPPTSAVPSPLARRASEGNVLPRRRHPAGRAIAP